MELDSGSHVAAVIQPTTAPSSTAQSAAQSDIAALRAEIAALTHRLDQQDTRGRSSTSDHGSRHGSRSNTPDRIYAFITPATEWRLASADPRANLRETAPPGTDGHRLSWPCLQWALPVRPRPCEQPSLSCRYWCGYQCGSSHSSWPSLRLLSFSLADSRQR